MLLTREEVGMLLTVAGLMKSYMGLVTVLVNREEVTMMEVLRVVVFEGYT